MTRLHKMVDGERVELSDEEEAEVRAEWAAEKTKSEQAEADRQTADGRRKIEKNAKGLPAVQAKLDELIDVLREQGVLLEP